MGDDGRAGEEWKLVVFSPAYNVEDTVEELVRRMDDAMAGTEDVDIERFVIVDDGSTDGTTEILRALEEEFGCLQVVEKNENEGPVKAVLDGMSEVRRLLMDAGITPDKAVVVRMDADLEHRPEDIPALIEPLIKEGKDLSVGFVPFEKGDGLLYSWFNRAAGRKESKSFLDHSIPQFSPGFYALKGDVFLQVVPEIEEMVEDLEERGSLATRNIDFLTLVTARSLNADLGVIQVSSVEDERKEKPSFRKVVTYWRSHRATMSFLRE